jgi:O-6-methylguanine DNA methyltransferase
MLANGRATIAFVIDVWVEQAPTGWFGVALHEGRLVATAVGSGHDDVLASIRRCLPPSHAFRVMEDGDAAARGMVSALSKLERGGDDVPPFVLCPDCVSSSLAAVLGTASLIPRGYVTTYGRIAAAAGTEARVVGRAMATNHLYPIVPCHRVVGVDFSMVGYNGRQDTAALRAKLDRLRAEARGHRQERLLGRLLVTPVEWAIRKALHDGVGAGQQLPLW